MTPVGVFRASSVIALVFIGSLCSLGSAMAQVAPGVTQSAAHTANLTGTVVQSNGTPVSGADVFLTGQGPVLRSRTDASGTFAFLSVPYGKYLIVVNATGLGQVTRSNVVVNGDINVAVQYAPKSSLNGLKTIANVTTRASGAHINVTPASIASVTPSEYAFQGNTSWEQLLNGVPGVAVSGAMGGGELEGDFIPGSPFKAAVLSINGALPYETSVTLDGMPLQNVSWNTELAAGGGFDLSYLPMSVFDTADVVRGPGANAPSIVGSIGGAFVLHPPGAVDHNRFEFSTSNDLYGGLTSNAKADFSFGHLSTTVAYGVYNSPGPLGSNADVLFGWGWPPATVNGQAFSCTNPSGCGGFPANFGSSTYRNCFCLLQTSLVACCTPWSTAWSVHNDAVGLTYNLGSSITAQVFYTNARSTTEEALAAYPLQFTPGPGYSGTIAPGTYDNFIGVFGPYHLAQSSYLAEERITQHSARGVLRLAAVQNNSWVSSHLASGQPDGQYTLYGTGVEGNTPVTFNGTQAPVTFPPFTWDSDFYVHNRDLLASYAAQIGSASSAAISYVTSYYNAPYNYSFIYFTPTPVFSGSQPPDVSETTNEVRVNAGSQVGRLSFDASWYFAEGSYHVVNPANPNGRSDSVFRYNAPRVGATWRATPDFVIRAAAGGGFALPPLEYVATANGLSQCFGSYCTQTITNLNLKPEESFGFDVGTDIRPRPDTTISLDLYRTNLYGQFFQSTNLTGTFTGLPLYTTEYENLAQSRYEGVNLAIQHDPTTGLYWKAALGLTRGYVVNVPSGFYNSSSGPNTVNTYIVPGINFSGSYESGLPAIPYANGSAKLGYRWAPGRYVDISPSYYGNNNSYFEPAFVEFDAHAGYAFTKNISLLATFRNFTGIYDRNYQVYTPSLGAPATAGLPYPLFGIPYGPRALIVTLNVKS